MVLFGEIVPGGESRSGREGGIGLRRFRGILEAIRRRARVVPLPGAACAADVELCAGDHCRARQVSLAFAGGFSDHLEYVAPLLSALRLPGHFFIPPDQIGLPGRVHISQLRITDTSLPGIRLEVDCSGETPESLRRQVERLRQTARMLRHLSGRVPAYVWLGSRSLDARLSLLLSQSGYAGALCFDPPPALVGRGIRLLQAKRPPDGLWARLLAA